VRRVFIRPFHGYRRVRETGEVNIYRRVLTACGRGPKLLSPHLTVRFRLFELTAPSRPQMNQGVNEVASQQPKSTEHQTEKCMLILASSKASGQGPWGAPVAPRARFFPHAPIPIGCSRLHERASFDPTTHVF
jgi:hypothetical protein